MAIESGIYCYENMLNGVKYVGQSINLKKRKWTHARVFKGEHKDSLGSYFYNAVKKYGVDNFEYSILKKCPKDELDYWEIIFIKDMMSHYSVGGYNLTTGGQGASGWSGGNLGKKSSSASSKYFGVSISYYKDSIRWVASVRNSGKLYYIKSSYDEIVAAVAYDRYILEHGINRPLNFKNGEYSNMILPNGTKGRKLRSGGTSEYFGVSFVNGKTRRPHWRARIRIDGKSKSIKSSRISEEICALAYDKYVIENDLDIPLNFPERAFLHKLKE